MVNFDQQFILINIRSFIPRNHVKEFLESVLLNVSSYLLGDVHEMEKGVPRLLFAAIWFGKILLKKYQIFQASFITFEIFSVVFQKSPQVVLLEQKKKIHLTYLVLLVLQLSCSLCFVHGILQFVRINLSCSHEQIYLSRCAYLQSLSQSRI